MNHLGALRVSLLLAIGVVPVACGGTVSNGDDDGDDGGGGSSSGKGGASATGGTRARAGTSSGEGGSTTGTGGTGKMLPPIGGAGGASTLPTCTSPKLDALSGLVRCNEGYAHRPNKVACEGFGGLPQEPDSSAGAGGAGDAPARPRANGNVVCGDYGAGGVSNEETCNEFELGFCRDGSAGFALPTCDSGCVNDEDCGTGLLCECGHAESPSGGVCVSASGCTTDAACGPGNFCASYTRPCGDYGFACFSPADQCRSNADCSGSSCTLNDGYRACDNAVCGRPFLVESTARVAPALPSSEWNERHARTPRVSHLMAEERACLAQHWTRLGQMEHASIAAFARFSLQLLSLGAPPELVEACTGALADETAHTKLCFGIASAYAGRAIGPGPLDVSGSLKVTTLAEVVELVIAEGCFGETVAALEALEAAETAADPVIRDAYTRIARDEQRHAELAFQFVRWALEQDRAGVSDCVEAALHTVSVRPDVLRAVVEPCFAALLLARAA